MKKNKYTFEYIGKLDVKIAKYWNIDDHANKPIVIYKDRKNHVIENHLKDFGTIKKIDYIWSKLPIIIKKTESTFYNEKTKGLEFYKKIDEMIVVAVRISLGSSLKIRSFYPANKNKIQNRQTKKEKMYIEGKINDKIK